MTRKTWTIATMLLILIAACGGSAAPTSSQGTQAPGTTGAPQATTTTATAADGTTTTIEVKPCVDEVNEIDFGAATDVAIPDGASRVYLCAQVPNGVTALRIEVPDPDGALTLYLGYPDLDIVQHGGFEGVEFWQGDDEGGTLVIALEPLIHRGGLLEEDTQDEFMRPGSYYIEVDGPAGTAITVTVSEA